MVEQLFKLEIICRINMLF